MKKLLAMILAVVMVCAAAVTVSAAPVTSVPDSSNTADVSVAFVDEEGNAITAAEVVYSVDVAFEDLSFEYTVTNINVESGMIWDPATHTYIGGDSGTDALTFDAPAAIEDGIVVTNHSNAQVNVTVAFANDTKTSDAVNGVVTSLAGTDAVLDDAALIAYGNVAAAASLSYDVSVSGTPTSNPYQEFIAATITVTIDAV